MKNREATPKQKEVLDFIISYHRHTGSAPNFNQIKEALNYDSLTPVYTCVRELETKGYLAMRTSEQPDIVPVRKRTGAWLQEPSIRNGEQIPIVGTFKHGFLDADAIVSPRMEASKIPGWLESAEYDQHIDFAVISEGFAGIGKTVPSGSILLCSMQVAPQEGDAIIERIEQNWKLAKFTEDKNAVAVIVDIVNETKS